MFDFSVNFEAIDNITSTIDKINKKLDYMMRKVKSVASKLDIKSKIKINTQQATKKIGDLADKANNLKKGLIFKGKLKLGNMMAKLQSLKDRIESLSKKAIVIGGVGLAGMWKMIDGAKRYESSWKDVKKAVDGTANGMSKLRTWTKNFEGASFDEVSQVLADSGRMGMVEETVRGFAEPIIHGAIALDFDPGEAVSAMGEILAKTDQLKDAARASMNLMDKFTNLENTTAGVKAADIINIMGRNAQVYKDLNFDNTLMTGISAFSRQIAPNAELGASGFNTLITMLEKSDKKLGLYSKIKNGGAQGFIDVMKYLDNMDGADRLKMLGSYANKFAKGLAGSGAIDKFQKTLENASDKNATGAVMKEWAVYSNTLEYTLKKMSKAGMNATDSIGRIFIPAMKVIADVITLVSDKLQIWTDKHPKLAKVIGYTITILSMLAVVAGTVALAMFAISAAMLPWIIGIGAVVAALVTLSVYWDEISFGIDWWLSEISDAWSEFRDQVSLAIKPLKELWSAFKDSYVISTIIDGITFSISYLSDAFNNVKTYISEFWNSFSMSDVIHASIRGIANTMTFLSNVFLTLSSYITNGLISLQQWWSSWQYASTVVTILQAIALPFLGIAAIVKYLYTTLSEFWNSFNISEQAISFLSMLMVPIDWIANQLSSLLELTDSWGLSFGFVDGAIELIDMLISPITYIINLISELLSNLDIVNGIKSKLGDIGTSVTNAYNSVVDYVTGEDDKQKNPQPVKNSLMENNINRGPANSQVDIMVRADKDSTAVAHHKENGTIKKLRTNRNYGGN